jgi:hypothetical protein
LLIENKYKKTGSFKKSKGFNFEVRQENTNPIMNLGSVVGNREKRKKIIKEYLY